jgi:hypothetical protein
MFLPIAAIGLTSLGMGLLSFASNGAYNVVEVVAILLGLIVVAIAGIFTIRSNVAKIWREQAEAEKARVVDLGQQIADITKENAVLVTALRREVDEQRQLKHQALDDLMDANKRTDLSALMEEMRVQHAQLVELLQKGTPCITG